MRSDFSTMIIVRNLTAKDRRLLKILREKFDTKSNAKAVMRAAEGYEVQASKVDEHRYNAIKDELDRTREDLLKMKALVAVYFSHAEANQLRESEFEQKNAEYTEALKKLANDID